jgi:hypothetical protein
VDSPAVDMPAGSVAVATVVAADTGKLGSLRD